MAEDKKVEKQDVDFDKPEGYDEAIAEQKVEVEEQKKLDIEPTTVVRSALPTVGAVIPPLKAESANVSWEGVHSDADRKALEIARNEEVGAIPAVVDAKLAEKTAKNEDKDAKKKTQAQVKAAQENK
jgi:hypothetical protein